jgi:hypothetical protein
LIDATKHVAIEFDCIEPGKRAAVSWRTNEPHLKIFINRILKERMESDAIQPLEKKMIIVSIAFAITHQLMHLFLNLLNMDECSEFKVLEAGEYFEKTMFGHKFHVIVKNLKDRQKWTCEMEVKGNIMF